MHKLFHTCIFFFQVNFFSQSLPFGYIHCRDGVHNKAPHAAQLEMWVSSAGKVSGIYLWHWIEKTQIRQSPPKCLYIYILIQRFSNLLCPITHCALWLSGPLLLSLGKNLPLLFLQSWQTGLKNKGQIIHISAVGGLTDTFCAGVPMEEVQQNLAIKIVAPSEKQCCRNFHSKQNPIQRQAFGENL